MPGTIGQKKAADWIYAVGCYSSIQYFIVRNFICQSFLWKEQGGSGHAPDEDFLLPVFLMCS
jgi:hypothetical protein